MMLNDMHKKIRQNGWLGSLLAAICLIVTAFAAQAQHVYQFDIKEDIGTNARRQVKSAYMKEEKAKVELVLIEMNTFGGMVNFADTSGSRVLYYTLDRDIFIN